MIWKNIAQFGRNVCSLPIALIGVRKSIGERANSAALWFADQPSCTANRCNQHALAIILLVALCYTLSIYTNISYKKITITTNSDLPTLCLIKYLRDVPMRWLLSLD